MATMRPELSDAELDSLPRKRRAEVKFYRACRDHLPDRILVHYSIHMLNDRMVEGEADFVIFDPHQGMLVVEIKGGGVRFDPVTGRWTSVNAEGEENEIRDPFLQASARCHDLRRLITENARFKHYVQGWITAGYAGVFPDLSSRQVERLIRPDTRPSILGSYEDLSRLSSWVSEALTTWRKPDEVALGPSGLGIVESILCKPIDVRPLISARLRAEEEVRVRLTDQQALILDLLGERSRVAIAGGAGTGKTLLALEQARRLAASGRRALLLCYNRALADHLKHVVGNNPDLVPTSIQQLYEWWLSIIDTKHGRNLLREMEGQHPGVSRNDVHLPGAFAIALEDYDPPTFGAVIVDEGQDFKDDDWLAVQTLIERIGSSLCIFYDHNQRLYRCSSYFPITDEREIFPLTRNCRNTIPIHEACYRYYDGPATKGPPIKGEPIACSAAPTLEEQARLIGEKVRGLLAEDVSPDDIAVLLLGVEGSKGRFFQALQRLPLPGGIRWIKETHRQERTILVDTVARFKGLERMIIFLWLGSDVDVHVHRELIYVGMSRAKSRLYLVGSADACRAAQAETAAMTSAILK